MAKMYINCRKIKLIAAFYKSYDQKKFMSDLMAISFVFWPDNRQGLSDPFLFFGPPYIYIYSKNI